MGRDHREVTIESTRDRESIDHALDVAPRWMPSYFRTPGPIEVSTIERPVRAYRDTGVEFDDGLPDGRFVKLVYPAHMVNVTLRVDDADARAIVQGLLRQFGGGLLV